MAARPDAVAFAPFPKGLPGVSLALGQNPTGFITRLDRSPDLRRRARPAVTFDRHVALSSRSARRIERVMKSARRRGWHVWMAPFLQGLFQVTLILCGLRSCVRPVDAALHDRWP